MTQNTQNTSKGSQSESTLVSFGDTCQHFKLSNEWMNEKTYTFTNLKVLNVR